MNDNNKSILTMAVSVLAITISILALVLIFTHHSKPKQSHHGQDVTVHAKIAPCTTDANPCIELLDPKGAVVAKFNDFRFGDKGCVWYSRLGDHKWVSYCGGSMKWIGPAPATKA